MVDTVITLGRQHLRANFRSIDDTPTGDLREISFRCHFSDDAVNSGTFPAPPPSIHVQWWGTVSPLDLRVELIPPGLPPEWLLARTQRTLVPWASERTGDETDAGPRPSRSASRRLVQDDPFEHDWFEDGEMAPIDPGDDLPPGGGGGGGQSYTRIIDPATDPTGTWRLRVRYFGRESADLHFTVEHPHTVQVIEETRIPFQLINRAFRQAMLALQLRLKVDNGQARITFDAGFKALTGIDDLIYDVSDRLQDINLEEYNIEMGNDNGRPAIFAGFDLEERGDEIGIPGPDINIANMAVCLRLGLQYGYPPGPDFFDTAMMFDNFQTSHPAIYVSPQLDANPEIVSMWRPFADTILGLTGCLGLTLSSVHEYVQEAVADTESALHGPIQHASKYIYDTIMHLAERSHVMHELRADNDAMIVKHHRKPSVRDFLDDLNATEPTEGGEIAPISTLAERSEEFNAGAAAVEASEDAAGEIAPVSASAEEPSPGPHHEGNSSAPSLVSSGGQTQDVGEHMIDHIVFLMMENRSFDHMLGYRGLASSEVNGLKGTESNRLTADVPPYPVFHYTKTFGIPSPAHGIEATLEQIADGAMSGFVKNYAKRDPLNDLRLVMSYYTGQELPMYEFLANNFAICDNWHSSHPGETQCNRFCAITGRTPELDNFDITDPQIAYYRAKTVFDVLTESNVDWVYVEGNIGFIRIFDQYRLDTQRVIPYRDRFTSDTFVERVREGRLPSVTFIDPNFIDIPPAWDANDDLPPADVCRGQELVRGVYDLLSNASTWDHTLLVITYDEHGGFFDHSVPAGMPGSAHPAPFPRVHPKGADHLGVRVPAFVVSPWIDAGTVIKTLFDHTSILKTIIERFAPAQFPVADVFGQRAATANELLSELNRTTVRQDQPSIPEIECHSRTSPAGPTAQLDGTDFVTSMRLLGLPPLYRGRLVT